MICIKKFFLTYLKTLFHPEDNDFLIKFFFELHTNYCHFPSSWQITECSHCYKIWFISTQNFFIQSNFILIIFLPLTYTVRFPIMKLVASYLKINPFR